MRAKLARFMTGRNGSDHMTRFVSVVVSVLLVFAMVIGGSVSYVLWVLAIAGLIYSYFRIFSRNVSKRREENMRYIQIKNEFLSYLRGAKERRSQRKDYKFFHCPSCHTILRVPRGKGKVKVICRKCGTSFVKKT
jgi:hypothetical protein